MSSPTQRFHVENAIVAAGVALVKTFGRGSDVTNRRQ